MSHFHHQRLHEAPQKHQWKDLEAVCVSCLSHKKFPATLRRSKECTEAKSCWDSYDICLLQLRWEADKTLFHSFFRSTANGLLLFFVYLLSVCLHDSDTIKAPYCRACVPSLLSLITGPRRCLPTDWSAVLISVDWNNHSHGSGPILAQLLVFVTCEILSDISFPSGPSRSDWRTPGALFSYPAALLGCLI